MFMYVLIIQGRRSPAVPPAPPGLRTVSKHLLMVKETLGSSAEGSTPVRHAIRCSDRPRFPQIKKKKEDPSNKAENPLVWV